MVMDKKNNSNHHILILICMPKYDIFLQERHQLKERQQHGVGRLRTGVGSDSGSERKRPTTGLALPHQHRSQQPWRAWSGVPSASRSSCSGSSSITSAHAERSALAVPSPVHPLLLLPIAVIATERTHIRPAEPTLAKFLPIEPW